MARPDLEQSALRQSVGEILFLKPKLSPRERKKIWRETLAIAQELLDSDGVDRELLADSRGSERWTNPVIFAHAGVSLELRLRKNIGGYTYSGMQEEFVGISLDVYKSGETDPIGSIFKFAQEKATYSSGGVDRRTQVLGRRNSATNEELISQRQAAREFKDLFRAQYPQLLHQSNSL